MTFDPGMPMVPEVALFVLAVIVLVVGMIRQLGITPPATDLLFYLIAQTK